MSQNFKLYSQYYDLLYQDKNYLAETDYIVSLIMRYQPGAKNIIELGAGTGKHANLLSKKGYQLLGIERSPEMVEIANRNKTPKVNFKVADITNFRTDKHFDVALSLFHVISYLTINEALIQTLKNVHQYLNDDGIFIFDVWHNAAVNAQKPEKRTKILQDEQIKVTRKATPIIRSEENIVEVNYAIEVEDLAQGTISIIEEKHPMRHFSKPELALLAYATGFEILASEEFLTQAKPSADTWGVCYIFKKIKNESNTR